MTAGTGTFSPARATMADLLLTLRGLTTAGSAEYTVNAVSYWTDTQLQAVLDRHVQFVRDELLFPNVTMQAGAEIAYLDYQSPHRFLESTDAGTARFIVKDETFTPIGAATYSVDYPRGKITFTADTEGLSRYLTGYSYDLNAAAADVWGQKAAHYSTAYDITTDNHGLRRSQIIQNCLLMAREYGAGAQVYSVSIDREDTDEADYVTR